MDAYLEHVVGGEEVRRNAVQAQRHRVSSLNVSSLHPYAQGSEFKIPKVFSTALVAPSKQAKTGFRGCSICVAH